MKMKNAVLASLQWGRLRRRHSASRVLTVLCALVLAFGLAGDRNVRSASNCAIDPLEILDITVKPNVLVLIDTSTSMYYATNPPPGYSNIVLGGDDSLSRLGQAKKALQQVLDENAKKYNIGLLSFSVKASEARVADVGPLTYVSSDAGADPFFYRTSKSSTYPCTAYDRNNKPYNRYGQGYFCDLSTTQANYDGTNSSDVFQSLGNGGAFAKPWPIDGLDTPYDSNDLPLCNNSSDKRECRYYLRSERFRNGVSYTFERSDTSFDYSGRLTATDDTFSCADHKAPVGLIAQTTEDPANPGYVQEVVPCFQIKDTGTNSAIFYLSSAVFTKGSGDNCGGPLKLAPVPACTAGLSPVIGNALRREVPISDTYTGVLETADNDLPIAGDALFSSVAPGTNGLGDVGVRTTTWTPLAKTLTAINGGSYFPDMTSSLPSDLAGNNYNYVLLLTDGDDTCYGGAFDTDGNAKGTAQAAETLYKATTATRKAETLLVAFTPDVNATYADRIAKAGSGGTVNSTWKGWDVSCASATGPCRPAFKAKTEAELLQQLKAALSIVAGSGEFTADSSSITGSVYELYDPESRETRYNKTVPVGVESSFDMPAFTGHFKAYYNPTGTATVRLWDAADTLQTQMAGLTTTSKEPFSALPGLIQRRIYSTTQNGVNSGYTVSNLVQSTQPTALTWTRVSLWPPDAAVDPNGGLDTELGVADTFANLQTTFKACTIASGIFPPGNDCGSTNAGKKLAQARKEAREIVLAYMAGAEPVLATAGTAYERDGTTGDILFRRKASVLADSTAGGAAFVGPPPDYGAAYHADAYKLYRYGPRAGGLAVGDRIAQGFGLRHPDSPKDQTDAQVANYKPVMTVVYHPANDMLHAFRAAACPSGVTACSGDSQGGEELWGFVPYDQLGKLKDHVLKANTRADHIFMLATSVRVADVFVPGTFKDADDDKTYDGVWRTVLIVGRGAGGKYYTGLDVTGPGSFLTTALATAPPIVMWNRGNPDTVKGVPVANGGTAVARTMNAITGGTPLTQYQAYQLMGETWSVPAVGMVPRTAVTANQNKEFAAWTTSGCSDVQTDSPNFAEGRSIFTMDPLTGDLIAAHNIGDCDAGDLIASPAAFQVARLTFSATGANTLSITDPVTGVYVGDLKGRMYFVDPTDPTLAPERMGIDYTSQQPFGTAVSLLNLDTDGTLKPHIYAETGNDRRVELKNSTDHFMMLALRDDKTGSRDATEVYKEDFAEDYRGTVQPVSSFFGDGTGVTFFAGTRLAADSTYPCVSSWDNVIYALQAGDSGADPAYDLPEGGGTYYHVEGDPGRVQSLSVDSGELGYNTSEIKAGVSPKVGAGLEQGVAAEDIPVAVGPPVNPDGTLGVPAPGTTAFRLGTSVCR